MNVWFWVYVCSWFINLLLLISMVFLERKKFSSIVCWMTVLTVLPVIGYIFYIVMGNGLSYRTRKMINKHKLYELDYNEEIKNILLMQEDLRDKLVDDAGIIKCCYNLGSILCPGNKIEFYRWGTEKISALKRDLLNAKKSINMEYYIC